jgi:ribonuclease HII
VERTGTKGAVLAHAFIRLLAWGVEVTAGEEPLFVCTDKQGGRNTYAEQVQQALAGGLVTPVEETAERSLYRVVGGPRPIELTFRPGADGAHFCVALASMLSKYLRELLMGELNSFWQQHVPGLAPTAGYPGDAARFLEAIRAAAERLQVPQVALWRFK